MGCDIHAISEIRRNGKWHLLSTEVPDDRNYISFAALANVRNGYGFAGCPTHEPIPCIDEPRGLPHDLSAGAHDIIDGGNDFLFGDHSKSWVTLAEMNAYAAAAAPVQRTGLAEPQNIGPDGVPSFWCGASYGPGSEKLIRCNWSTPFDEAAHTFTEIRKHLSWQVEGDITPDDLRIVFGFDS